MKYLWVGAVVLLLLAAPAEARKRCRPVEGGAPAAAPESLDRWTDGEGDSWVHMADPEWDREVKTNWVHEGVENDWVHQDDDRWSPNDRSRWVHSEGYRSVHDNDGTDWLHEADYGWWSDPDGIVEDPEEEEAADGQVVIVCTEDRGRNECPALVRQLAQYEYRLTLAEEREDEYWQASLEQIIERLKARQIVFECPEADTTEKKVREMARKAMDAIAVASKLAATLFQLGLL